MKSFLFSQLSKKYLRSDLEAFRAAFGHDWLVWEPGPWRPPAAQSSATVRAQPVDAKTGGEALAIALVLPPGKAELTLGRGEDNGIVINDATLSRTHMVFTQAPDGIWSVRDGGSSNGSLLDGKTLARVATELLSDGHHLQAGNVYFTYYSPRGLYFRLKGMG